jgi:hypothetical protein
MLKYLNMCNVILVLELFFREKKKISLDKARKIKENK